MSQESGQLAAGQLSRCDECGADVDARRHNYNACAKNILAAQPALLEAWTALGNAQRLSLIAECCSGCGTLDLPCHCQNDE
jgi:hypothetical protein